MNKLRQAFDEFSQLHKLELDNSQLILIDHLQKYLSIISSKSSFFSFKYLPMNKKNNSYSGIYIWGGVGRGKSMILNLFFDNLATENKLRMHFHEFMIEAHIKLNDIRKNPKIKDHLVRYATLLANDYKVIILDELQINNIADAMIVGRLFEALIKKGCYVFFSSNRMPSELFKNGLQRELFLPFINLIETMLEKYNLDNFIDYRFNNLKLSKSYLYPLTPNNQKLLQEIIVSLTGHENPYEQRIEVNSNRYITSYKTYGNLAVFSFKELCEVPLGAIDYLAICKYFKIIILEKISYLTLENHNELLRFITLIDCLYENKIKLICLAECPIEKIYTSGKHAFEFQRTISRLQEMHSKEYFESKEKII